MAARRRNNQLRTHGGSYTEEERSLILRYIARLRRGTIQDFLREVEEPVSGTKSALVARIDAALGKESVDYSQLVSFLDEVEPWRAQQVYLLGPSNIHRAPFLTPEALETHLRQHRALRPFRQPVPLVLPEDLTIASITHDGERLRITAVQRREGWERDEREDLAQGETKDGEPVEYRAYVRVILRGLTMFEWDVVSNTAMLQISRLPARGDYDEEFAKFAALTKKWLDLSTFSRVNLAKGIAAIHREEEERRDAGNALRADSHGVEYEGGGGARMSGRGPSSDGSVSEDPNLRAAYRQYRAVSVGRRGNFFWHLDPLGRVGEKAHVIVFATSKRITFPTNDLDEETIRHVLADIRSACV